MNKEKLIEQITRIIEDHSIDVRNEMNDGRFKSNTEKTVKKIIKLLKQ